MNSYYFIVSKTKSGNCVVIVIHHTYEITIIGGTHVPITTLRNGGG